MGYPFIIVVEMVNNGDIPLKASDFFTSFATSGVSLNRLYH
jgi:hypothetical protein